MNGPTLIGVTLLALHLFAGGRVFSQESEFATKLALPRIATHVCMSPDGHTVLTFSGTEARLWDTQSGRQQGETIKLERNLLCSGFSGDGRRVILGEGPIGQSEGRLSVWEATGTKKIGGPLSTGIPMAVGLSRDGATAVAFTIPESKILRWNILSGEISRTPLDEFILETWEGLTSHMRFSADLGTMLSFGPLKDPPPGQVTLDPPKVGKLWTSKGIRIGQATLTHGETVQSVAFSGDGKRLLTAAGPIANVWTASSGKLQTRFEEHGGKVAAAWLSNDGKFAISASADGTVRVWFSSSGKSVGIPFLHEGSVLAVGFQRDTNHVVAVSADGTLGRWPLAADVLKAK